MKNKTQVYIIGILLVILVYLTYIYITKTYIKENFGDCTNTSFGSGMPEKASEACQRISTKAEEIEAHYGGIANVIASYQAFINPRNYKAGDNKTTNMGRNIINTNLSQCEVEQIHNICDNSATSSQSNVISNQNCKYCQEYGCDITNNRQTNTAKINQQCSINLMIKALTQKTSSIDSQALAKVLQKAQGVLSGTNKTTIENCNLINTDMSSKNYLENKGECLSKIASLQENKLEGCGNIAGNMQKNDMIALQECMIGTTIEKETTMDAITSILTNFTGEQYSEGVTGMASASSISSSLLVSIIIIGVMVYFGEQEIM